jgi:hypothetical protein
MALLFLERSIPHIFCMPTCILKYPRFLVSSILILSLSLFSRVRSRARRRFLSGCIAHHCVNTTVETVDIDPDVEALAVSYFGWRNQTVVHLDGAERFFRAAADRGDKHDLVLFDCFSRHEIPYGCRTPLLLASVRRVLQRTRVDGKTLFAINMFGKSLAYRSNFTAAVRRHDAVEQLSGQWLSFTQS